MLPCIGRKLASEKAFSQVMEKCPKIRKIKLDVIFSFEDWIESRVNFFLVHLKYVFHIMKLNYAYLRFWT